MTLSALQCLGSYPFLDGVELSALSGLPRWSAFRQLRRLRDSGHVAVLPHATAHIPRTGRHYLTARGVRNFALALGVEPEEAVRSHPLSAEWYRILVRRLDAVAVIYRLASSMAGAATPVRGSISLRWYRSGAWDAAVLLNESIIAVMRMGPTADRIAFRKRLWSMEYQHQPAAILIIAHDEAEGRELCRRLAGRPLAAFVATERAVGMDAPSFRAWRVPGLDSPLSLVSVLKTLQRGGSAPPPHPSRRALLPNRAPRSESPLCRATGSEKRALDALADWPLIRHRHLAYLLGVESSRLYRIREWLASLCLIVSLKLTNAEGRRLALSDSGIRALAYRDRRDVATALRHWSAASDGRAEVKGTKLRQLARAIEHTDAVHDFLARLSAETRWMPGASLTEATPPHRAARYFRLRGRTRAILPDAAGAIRLGRERLPFILEWERRAKYPSKAVDRIGPYLRYFAGGSPADDFGVAPVILVAFEDVAAETQFILQAREKLAETGVLVPFLTSHIRAMAEYGIAGASWRSPNDPELRRVTLRDGGRGYRTRR